LFPIKADEDENPFVELADSPNMKVSTLFPSSDMAEQYLLPVGK